MRNSKSTVSSPLLSSSLSSTSLNLQLSNEAPWQRQQLDQQVEDKQGETCVLEATVQGGLDPDKDLSSVQSDSSNQSLQGSNPVQNQSHPELMLVLIRGEDGLWTCPDAEILDEEDCVSFFSDTTQMKNVQGLQGGGEEKKWSLKTETNGIRKESNSRAKADVGDSYSFDRVETGRWTEGEKVFPLKKRKGNWESEVREELTILEKMMKMEDILKRKMDKKYVHEENEKEVQEQEDELYGTTSAKRESGGVIMEGSSTSRISRRQRACYEQKILDYIHKERIKSMNSISKKEKEENQENKGKKQEETLLDKVEEEPNKEKPLITRKKRSKIGMVKSRSIRGLMNETNHSPLVTHNINK